jgi:hypothetical protein
MTLYAVRIGKRYSGDGEMVYLWKRKKDAVAYTIFLHAGEVVKMEVEEGKG